MATITTQRLVLRPWKFGDDKALARGFGSKKVRAWISEAPQGKYGLNEAREFIKMATENNGALYLAFTDKKSRELVGGGGFNKINFNQMSGEIGYWIAESQWGKGLATESTLAVMKYGFEKLKLHRISIVALENNEASLAVIRKCGFVPEGLHREDSQLEGKWAGTALFSMLAGEWKAKNK